METVVEGNIYSILFFSILSRQKEPTPNMAILFDVN